MNNKDTVSKNEFREQLVAKLPLFLKYIFSIVGGVFFTTSIVYVLNIAVVIYGQAYSKSFGIPYLPDKVDLLDFYTNNINLTMTLALAIPTILIVYVAGWLDLISSRKPTFMGVLAIFSTVFIFLFLYKDFSIYYYLIIVLISTLILFLTSNLLLKSYAKSMGKIAKKTIGKIANIPMFKNILSWFAFIFKNIWSRFASISVIKNCIEKIKITREENSRGDKKITLWDYAFYAFNCLYVFFLFFINVVALAAYFANSQGASDGAKDLKKMHDGEYFKTANHVILKESKEDAIVTQNDGTLYTVLKITKNGKIILDHLEKKDFNYYDEIQD